MDNVSPDRIKEFASNEVVEANEQVYVLTSSQLQDIIKQAVEKASKIQLDDLSKKYNTLLARFDAFCDYQDRLDGKIEAIEFRSNADNKMSALTRLRLKKLDEILIKRGEPVSYSEIGKLLELGNKYTRRQNMGLFAKTLHGLPDRYRITKSQRGNQRFVSLRPDYAKTLKM